MKNLLVASFVLFYSMNSYADYFACQFISRDESRLQSYFQCGTDKSKSCIDKSYIPESVVMSVVTKDGKRKEVVIKKPTSTVDTYSKKNNSDVLSSLRNHMEPGEKIASYTLRSANVKSLSIYRNCDLDKRGMEASYKNCEYSSVTRKVKSQNDSNKFFCASIVTCDGVTGYVMSELTSSGKCPDAMTSANSDLVTPNEATMQKILCREILPTTASGNNVANVSGCTPQGSVVAIEQPRPGSTSDSARAAK